MILGLMENIFGGLRMVKIVKNTEKIEKVVRESLFRS